MPGGTTGEVGIGLYDSVDLGPITLNDNEVTFVKDGPLDWEPEAGQLIDAASATLEARGGRLIGVGVDGFGGASLSIGAGELALSSPAGDFSVPNTITGAGDGVLSAGQISSGEAGPAVVTIQSRFG